MEVISLEEARKRLGADVVICLEPESIFLAKTKKAEDGTDKSAELWVFNPATGWSGRGDGKFFDCRYRDRGGWGQMVVHQEPGITPDSDGERIVAHVTIEKMGDLIRVRKNKDVDGRTILELKPSSYSKNELCDSGCKPMGTSSADPQRISGDILHFVKETEFPPEEGMTVAEFVAKSTDGRAFNALAKAGLLVPK